MKRFEVIKGGHPELSEYSFIDAAITDTRLMGVLGLRMHYVRTDYYPVQESTDFYYFLYYDIEELGLESVNVYCLDDPESLAVATKACFGGLGAVLWQLSEKEARWLTNEFVERTKARGKELPENMLHINFLLKEVPQLEEAEIARLSDKMCAMIKTDYGVVNYYLMRCFGKDEEGAGLLRSPYAPAECFDDLSLPVHATFLQNTIDEFHNSDGRISYMSRSLIETNSSHYIVTSDIRVEGRKVVEARSKSCFKISLEEASMLLARGEYCTVYRIFVPMEKFDADFALFSIGCTRSSHENGDMYMEFKPDNEHVNKKVYNLYDDIQNLYYVTDYGELIVAGYTEEDIKMAEKRIRADLCLDTQLMVKIQLATSVLYDFAQSEFTMFGQYLHALESLE